MLIAYCALFNAYFGTGQLALADAPGGRQAGFPRVKLFSAVAGIAGGVTLSLMKGETSPVQFYLAGAVSIVFGIFSLTLPHTPPKKTGQDVSISELLGLDALALMKKPWFAIFIVCMFLICIPLYFYFVMLGVYLSELKWEGMTAKMSLAQVSDVIFMFMLPIFLKNWGYKKTIFLGIVCWAIRYFLFGASVGNPGLETACILGAILLHGVCYDFLFIAGQLYVDDESDERSRRGPGFIAFILWGVGAFVGTKLAGSVLEANTLTAPVNGMAHNWKAIWQQPAWGAVAVLMHLPAGLPRATEKGIAQLPHESLA